MKFSTKIVFGTCMILALCFSVGGIYMVRQNFQVAYDTAVENGTKQHISHRYSLESNLRNALENGKDFDEELVTEYASRMDGYAETNNQMMVYEPIDENVSLKEKADQNTAIWYTSISRLNSTIMSYMKEHKNEYQVYQQEDSNFLLIASTITVAGHSVILLNQYDISSTFVERDRQIREFIQLDIMMVALSLILVSLLSWYLTRNIKKLSRVSSQIAEGEYSQRTGITSQDEIGELSRNFDAMAEAVEQHIEELNQEVLAREQFVSDFSHELKTPMTSMMGYSKLLLSGEPDEKVRRKAVDYIYRECRRLKTLSTTLLQMLGMTEEHIVCKRLYSDWIAERVRQVCESNLSHAILTMKVEKTEIYCDGELLVTLLRNLIENAVHACADQQKAEVTVRGEKGEQSYIFTVTDNGCGMAEEELKQVTRAFYMVDKSRSRKEGGSGLGLAICARICEVLNITMSMESSVGIGTSVVLVIPDRNPKQEDYEEECIDGKSKK